MDNFDGFVGFGEEKSAVNDWLSWGNYALNYISSKNLNNGVPQGKITDLSGLSGTGKSLLSLSLLRNKKLDYVFLFETEGAPVRDLLNFIDVDDDTKKKIKSTKVSTFSSYRVSKNTGRMEEVVDSKLPNKKDTDLYIYVEGLTSKVRNLLHLLSFHKDFKDKKILIILDSLANLQGIRAQGGGLDMGRRGQEISNFFRSFDNEFEKSNIYFVYTNKLYQSFNPYQPWIESGGVSVAYNPSLSIRLENTSTSDDLSDTDVKKEKENMTGGLGKSIKNLRATIIKSRFGPEGKKATFLLDFNSGGISKISGLFSLLNIHGVLEKEGRKFIIPGIIEDKFYKKDFIELVLKDEENIINKLQERLDEKEKERKNKKEVEIMDIVEEGDNEEEIYDVDKNEQIRRMELDI